MAFSSIPSGAVLLLSETSGSVWQGNEFQWWADLRDVDTRYLKNVIWNSRNHKTLTFILFQRNYENEIEQLVGLGLKIKLILDRQLAAIIYDRVHLSRNVLLVNGRERLF